MKILIKILIFFQIEANERIVRKSGYYLKDDVIPERKMPCAWKKNCVPVDFQFPVTTGGKIARFIISFRLLRDKIASNCSTLKQSRTTTRESWQTIKALFVMEIRKERRKERKG